MKLFCFEVKYPSGHRRLLRVVHHGMEEAKKTLKNQGWYDPDTDDLFYEWAINLEPGYVFTKEM